MLEHRKLAENWKYKLSMSEMMLSYKDKMKNKIEKGKTYFNGTTKSEDEIMNDILKNRKTLKP
jgi:hypothetical protein